MPRKLHFLSDTRAQAKFFRELAKTDDKLVPLSMAPKYGFSYSQLNRWVEAGRLKSYVKWGTRYALESDLEELEPPPRGRPKGVSHLKALTPEELGHVI